MNVVSSHAGVPLAALCDALPEDDAASVRLAVLDLELNGLVSVLAPR
jgi:hypothetical protein